MSTERTAVATAAPPAARRGRHAAERPVADASGVAGITVPCVPAARAVGTPSGPDA